MRGEKGAPGPPRAWKCRIARPDPHSYPLVHPRGVVSGLVEERQSSHSMIQDVLGEVSSSEAWTARHGGFSVESVAILSRKRLPTPFLVFDPVPFYYQ